jgi:hypothetical protein
MIVKIFGFIDILTAILFALFSAFGFASSLLMFFTLLLLAKGIFFAVYLDLFSFIDIAVAFVVFFGIFFTTPYFLIIIISVYLFGKGLFSLI